MTDSVTDMAASVTAVERLLDYTRSFCKKLLEEALTHPSYTNSASYQRLEFVGDAALGLAVSKHVFSAYPGVNQGQLSLIRAANVSTEKLARVAVKHELHIYVRHSVPALHAKVRDFALAVKREDETEVYGGAIKAPKILADIIESVAAAVYVDCGFDLQTLWNIFTGLLEPIITLDELQQYPQPVTQLFQLCQKYGKKVYIREQRKREENVAIIYIDQKIVASASSKQKKIAKLLAAKAAVKKLKELSYKTGAKINMDFIGELNGSSEIEGAKQKLHVLCGKKRWSKPNYRIEKKIGLAHERRYTCFVHIEIAEKVISEIGDEKLRVKDAENSAASVMLLELQDSKYL